MCISIADSGDGIGIDRLSNIFDLFTQNDKESTANRKAEGTGLGLPISMELVRLMKGTLGLSTKVGEGTAFYIKIPLFSVSEEEDESPYLLTKWSEFEDISVLLAAPAMTASVLQNRLWIWGCQVKIVTSWEELYAWNPSQAGFEPDFVLIDEALPLRAVDMGTLPLAYTPNGDSGVILSSVVERDGK